MSVPYTVDKAESVIRAKPEGVLQIRDILEYFLEVATDDDIPAGCVELVDFSGVTEFVFSYSDASDITTSYLRMKTAKGLLGTIFLAPTPESYGVARMLEGLLGVNESKQCARAAHDQTDVEAILTELRAPT